MSELTPYPQPKKYGWISFPTDPRKPANTSMRATDADRDVVNAILGEAYAQGQLDRLEYEERLTTSTSLKTLGEIPELVQDLVSTGPPTQHVNVREPASPVEKRWQTGVGATLLSWGIVAAVTNLVWLMTSLSAGELIYYWPMWPMLGMTIAVVSALAKQASYGSERDRLERRRRRELDR